MATFVICCLFGLLVISRVDHTFANICEFFERKYSWSESRCALAAMIVLLAPFATIGAIGGALS